MKRKFLWAAAAVIFVLLLTGTYLTVSGKVALWFREDNLPPFDRSIKTEYGTPIEVRRVIDGDTVELINGDRLRYIGMDTPEEVDPKKPVQCFAAEAAARNRDLVEGKMVTLYKDVSQYDEHGRWLAFVYLEDGTFVNLELVKEGFAFNYPYPPDISRADEFGTAEAEAQKNGLGLWGECKTYHTSTGRSQTNTLGR